MWSDDGVEWTEVQYEGESMFVVDGSEAYVYIDQKGVPIENDDGAELTTMPDDTEWEVIANTSHVGKFMGDVYAMGFTYTSVKEDASPELEDELLDKYAPGKMIDADELSIQEGGGETQSDIPMVT